MSKPQWVFTAYRERRRQLVTFRIENKEDGPTGPLTVTAAGSRDVKSIESIQPGSRGGSSIPDPENRISKLFLAGTGPAGETVRKSVDVR